MQKNSKTDLEKTTNLFSQYFQFIIIFIIFIIFATSYFFLLKPKYNELCFEKKLNIERKNKEFKKQEEYLSLLKLLKENFGKIKDEDMEKLNLILPREEDIPGLIVALESLAGENGAILLGIDVSEIGEKSRSPREKKESLTEKKPDISEKQFFTIKELMINVRLSAIDYETLKRFLGAIETNMRIMDITSFGFNPEKGSCNIRLKTYYLEEKG